jgi:oligopeptidase B
VQHSPRAPKIQHIRSIHGETVPDEWFWLRDRQHPETIPYLEAENRYTEEMTGASKPLEAALYTEMVGRIQEDDTTCPWRFGDFEYYSRTERGKQYPTLCRRIPDGPEEIMLDCNLLAANHDYFSLAFHEVSPDGKILAFAIDTDGSEVYTLRFKNLATGEMLPDQVSGVYYSAAWDAKGTAFFYTTLDEIKRPHRLWRHDLGAEKAGTLLLEEPDQRFNVSVDRCRSGRYLFVTTGSHTTTEVRYLDAGNSAGELRLIQPRQQDVEYFMEHHAAGDVDWFYMRTNQGGKNFRLLRALTADPSRWEEVIPHSKDITLERVEAFRDHLVLIERAAGLKRLRVFNTRTGAEHFVRFDEPAYTIYRDQNEQYDTAKFRFVYTSLTTPRSVYDYDMDSRERELKKQYAVLGGYEASNYVSERIFATSHDGTEVPISLVHRKGLEGSFPAPLYLYGYGSYGIVTEPSFSAERVSLLDRGFVFAIAHIRGSGDMGRFWYEDGKLRHKKNSFLDFIACAEHLIAKGYTSPDRLAIAGGSAGGLLMGAVTNLRPDLFRAVVAHVPFVDVVNTMLDPTLPLTVTEYEEWGNPNDRDSFEYIQSYAPYENVERKAYPNILVTAGLNDPRVPYWEPAKWVAKLRDMKTDENLIVLKTNMGAGHGGPSGRYEKLREKAFEYAFVLRILGYSGNSGTQ